MNEDGLKSNRDFLVTKSEIPATIPVSDIFAYLRKRKTSGGIVFALYEGGVRSISLEEETRMPESCRDSVRKILKME